MHGAEVGVEGGGEAGDVVVLEEVEVAAIDVVDF